MEHKVIYRIKTKAIEIIIKKKKTLTTSTNKTHDLPTHTQTNDLSNNGGNTSLI